MRIFIVPSWYGTEDKPMNGVFFKEQALALRQAGNEVCVLYPDLRFRLGSLQKGLFQAPGEPPTYIYRRRSLTPFWERGRWPQRALMLERLYRRAVKEHGRPDVVHLHSCRMGMETLWLCRQHNLPLVVTEHYSGVMGPMGGALRQAFVTTLRRCDRAVAVSGAMRDRMLSVRPDTVIIPNMVDSSAFTIQKPPRALEGFVFGAMGNLVPVKRYDLLLRAFAGALHEIPDARLVIAGQGEELGRLTALAAQLGVSPQVTFCGPVERKDAPAFYNAIHALVCSSDKETFGMTLIEAMACGRPVAATCCGGPQEIVTPDRGTLAQPGDAEGLARAMAELWCDRDRFDPGRIRADCMRRFGCETVVAALTGQYQRAIMEHGFQR